MKTAIIIGFGGMGIRHFKALKKLKITKQSLNRVLNDLIKLDIIFFKKDKKDSRMKHIFLNDKGEKIFKSLSLTILESYFINKN